MSPRLDLRQTQSLVMTPQLQQAIKLLALSNLEVESFISDALESNPLLDTSGQEGADAGPSNTASDGPDPVAEQSAATSTESVSSDELIRQGAGEADAPLDIDSSALDRDRDTGDWSATASASSGAGSSDAGPSIDERGSGGPTLAEHLEAQIGSVAPDPQSAFIARHIIGQIDDAGYLTADLSEMAHDLGVSEDDVAQALHLVQSLDPTGVGARSLAECLALQAREADRFDPCMEKLINNLDLIAKGRFDQIRRICNVDEEDFADMLAELRGYNPKPGLCFDNADHEPVVPDILISATPDFGWDIALNPETLPRLIVNRDYYVELRGDCQDKSSRGWLQEKLADANWLIKALDQRQRTILKVTAEIVKHQEGFFRKGVAHLKPLTLRTVAEAIDMHESTVSRVTSNKYLNCARGTFELKYFFTSGVAAADGDGSVSAESVKAEIRSLVDAEDPKKILSDDKLVELLREKGFDLARRTVAKYREAIGIGSSVQRRRQKKMAGLK
nr:RNA polymerase factor sigma-54 [Altericroceibacterium endophyticum]